jgi:dihydropteroate synthase
MKNILFITGKLAEKGLRTVIESIENKDFTYEIRNLNVNVAALLTTDMIERRIGNIDSFDEIIIPGRVRGDLESLKENINKKIIRGPDELKDLPTLFGASPVKYDLSKFETSIFGEITDALNMTVEEVIKRAEYFRLEGADVIDIGCLPNKKFPHLEEIVQELKNRNFYVSIDSHNTEELIRGSKAGADYLLSIKDETYHILENLDSYPVLIPTDNNMPNFYKLIDRAVQDKLTFIADPILDPISYGFTKSIERYIYLREKYPDIHIMIGIGNITELTHADTSGINMIMLGIVEELKLNHILTTQVSRHCSTVIRETDLARRIIHAASENNITPKHINNGLLINHGH